jgi:hypothetical protein
LRALFYSTSLLETILVKQVIEILKCLAEVVHNVFNQFKFLGCSGLRVLKIDALCNFGEVFFCHGVLVLILWFNFLSYASIPMFRVHAFRVCMMRER